MEENLRKPPVNFERGIVPVQTMEEAIAGDLFDVSEANPADPDFGVLTDYYGIFGEMEEYLL